MRHRFILGISVLLLTACDGFGSKPILALNTASTASETQEDPNTSASIPGNQNAQLCKTSEVLHNGQCFQKSRACEIKNGTGTQSFTNGSYGACNVVTCNTGFDAIQLTQTCQYKTRSCAIADGSGVEAWNGTAWGPCTLLSCSSGFFENGNSCLSTSQPIITVSSKQIQPGGNIQLSWNGGTNANTCLVSLTDVNRINYQPWAAARSGSSRVDALSVDTVFSLVCIDNSGNYLPVSPSVTVRIDKASILQTYLQRLTDLQLLRAGLWNQTAGDWEIWYDAIGTPADRVPMAFVWDNPIDDDALELYGEGRGFRFNTPSPGFLTVDRVAHPGDRNKGSVISRRDEFLRRDFGFTLEFTVKLFPDSSEDGFNAYYAMEDGTVIGVFLSPGKIKAGGYAQDRLGFAPGTIAALDTTSNYTVYRLVQYPGQSHFYVYANNSPTPILEADGNKIKVGSVSTQENPYIIVGGERGDTPAHFTLQNVRYRRGAFPPGVTMPPPMKRSAPSLPKPLPIVVKENFIPGFDGTFVPSLDPTQVFYGFSSNAGWTKLAGGIVEYNAFKSADTCVIKDVPGLVGQGDITIEARIKVRSDHEHRGFSIVLSDEMGTVTLIFSRDKVELGLGLKNVGYIDVGIQTAMMNTTNAFHKYRLVRKRHEMYAYLYVDDNPIPVIFDQHLDGSTGLSSAPAYAFLEFGHMFNPGPGRGHVEIDYISWAPTAYGPPAPF